MSVCCPILSRTLKHGTDAVKASKLIFDDHSELS